MKMSNYRIAFYDVETYLTVPEFDSLLYGYGLSLASANVINDYRGMHTF